MQLISNDILAHYEAALKTRAVPVSCHAEYRKWLRYYLDFRSKYPFPDSKSEQVRAFIEKLRKKNQSHEQQQQAAHVSPSQAEAITPTAPSPSDRQRSQPVLETTPATPQQADIPLPRDGDHQVPDPQSSSQSPVPRVATGKRYNEWRCLEKSGSPDWDTIIDSLAAEITTRHYSRKTLKAYAEWGRKFQGFLRNKSPDESSADVKSYITYHAFGGDMHGVGFNAESGVQRLVVCVPAYSEERLWRSQGYFPRKEIEIYPRGSFSQRN